MTEMNIEVPQANIDKIMDLAIKVSSLVGKVHFVSVGIVVALIVAKIAHRKGLFDSVAEAK